jgi:hypothetical protein
MYAINCFFMFIVPVGVYELCMENNNRPQPTLYVILLKYKTDQFRSFWTIFRLCSYPIVTKSLHTQAEGLLLDKSNSCMIVYYKTVVNCYKIVFIEGK